jgi:hypothetical protein
MQTIKEEWIKIYLLDDNSMLDVVFCATKDYFPCCDNNEVFHIPASFKLFQVNPYLATMKVIPHLAMVAHQNQVHHTSDLAITSTCKWVWAISTKKNPNKTPFHLIYLWQKPDLWQIVDARSWRDGSTLLHYTSKRLGHELLNERTCIRNILEKWAPPLPIPFRVRWKDVATKLN